MEKNIICTVCPTGCIIKVVGDEKSIASIQGYTCPRGKAYGEAEYLAPVRTLTSTVKVKGGKNVLVACRSEKPLPKDKVLSCMDVIRKIELSAPVKRGTIVVENILDTGVNIVTTGEAE